MSSVIQRVQVDNIAHNTVMGPDQVVVEILAKNGTAVDLKTWLEDALSYGYGVPVDCSKAAYTMLSAKASALEVDSQELKLVQITQNMEHLKTNETTQK